jgi:hypothetical protein
LTAQAIESADLPEIRSLIDEEVNRLPEKCRVAVLLCYFQGRTNEAAARELGCPKGTVVSRLARARERLRRRLQMRGIDSPTLFASAVVTSNWSASVPPGLLTKTCKAALANSSLKPAAAVVSARVFTLVQGAVRTMFWSKVRLIAVWLGTVVVGMGGAGLTVSSVYGISRIEEAEPLTTDPIDSTEAPRADAPAQEVENTPKRAASANNLKQIALAMHNYHDTNGSRFPAPAITGPNGKALLSWRVELLPFLEQANLYKQFRRDESWDSPHNRALLDKMPAVYAFPGTDSQAGSTYYQVFVGPGAAFEKRKRLRLADFTDGTSNTVLLIEAGAPVPWTKPEDLVYDPDQPLPELGGALKGSMSFALADGSVHTLRPGFDKEELHKMITRNGGEIVDNDRLFGAQTGAHQAQRQKSEHAGLVHGFQGLRDEVLSLRAEINRLKERIEKLERGK